MENFLRKVETFRFPVHTEKNKKKAETPYLQQVPTRKDIIKAK